jgi:hypothetical protein
MEPPQNQQLNRIRTDIQQMRENSPLCEVGFPTLMEMRELNTTIVATRILMNERQPVRHFFTNRRIQDEYVMKKGTPSPIFIKTVDKFGELGVDTRKVETALSYNGVHT